MREVELGLSAETEDADETAAAIARMLEDPLHERHPLKIGDGKYVDFQLIRKYNRYAAKWRYDNDLRFILRVKTDGDTLDVDDLLQRVSAVEGEWRVVLDR